MKLLFVALAAAMVLAALGFLLLPLLRAGRRAGRPRAPFALAVVLAFALPLVSAGLYLWLGTPAALQPGALNRPTPDLDQATAQLQQKLAQSPDDLRGWMLLAQAYDATQRPDAARDALAHAIKLAPNDPQVIVAYAEAASLARADHRIDQDMRKLLQRALRIDPKQQRALWLLGISYFQGGDHAQAVNVWQRLLPLLQPGSKVADAVRQQIAEAQARAGVPAAAATMGTTSVASATAAPAAPALQVHVSLSPTLADQVHKGDVLYVYARAVRGPPMPLAVQRLDAQALPATVTLRDGMGMTPQMTLSSVRRVRVQARISRSGDAMPQAGDLEARAASVEVARRAPVVLVIDHARGSSSSRPESGRKPDTGK